MEIYQISESQERASSKRFSNVCRPTRVAIDRASAVRSAVQNYNIFASYQKLTEKYLISPLFSRGEKSFQISVFSRRIVSRSCRGAWEGARDAGVDAGLLPQAPTATRWHLKTDDRAKDLPNAGERKLVSFVKRIKKRGAVNHDSTPLGYWVL